MTEHGRHTFQDRTAAITGASRGIGLAIARAIVDGGGRVVLTARHADELDEAVESLGSAAIGVRGGADDPEHAAIVADRAVAAFGSLDYLVNNAATNPAVGPLQSFDLDAWDKTLRVNLRGALVFVQEAWRAWMGKHGGAVVNVSSIGAMSVSPGMGAYNVSKGALLDLTRQLAYDMAPGVRVNAVAPAVVRTKFARVLYEGEADPSDTYPLKRLGEPSDVASAVCYLLSDDARWITGQVLVLDGGATLASPYAEKMPT